MRFNLKLFVLVGVLAGFRDVYGTEDVKNDDAAGFYVNKTVEENEKLKAAVKGMKVIKAVYKPGSGGDVDIIHKNFKDKLSYILVYDGNAVDEKDIKAINEFNPNEEDRLFYSMEAYVDYTFYFIFNKELFDGAAVDLLNSTASMFEKCGNLISADFTYFNTENVTDMNSMFGICSFLAELNLSNFDTKNVTNMSSMFQGCYSLNKLDLSKFDTTSVKDMSWMFAGCTALKDLDLSSFNTKSVTDMHYMFQGCIGFTELDLSKFDTKNVTNMSSMFEGCTDLKNLNLGNVDFHNVFKIDDMFTGCNFDNLCLPNTMERRWCCCGRYVCLEGKVVVKLNQNNVEFEVVKDDPVSNNTSNLV